MRYPFTIPLWLLLCVPSIAQEIAVPVSAIVGPALIIEGPETAAVGELVVLDVITADEARFAWTVLPATTNFLAVNDGRQAVFSSGVPGVTQIVHSVTVGAQPPQPDPPVPPPNPTPPPAPSGSRWLILIEESKDRTLEFGKLLVDKTLKTSRENDQ